MGARTGRAYLERLRDNSPEVWIGAEVVKDVVSHPATAQAVRTIASLYDLQLEPGYREFMVYQLPGSDEFVSTQFLPPTSQDDLQKRRLMHKAVADRTFGLMGRTTDFLGAMLTGFYIAADVFGDFAENLRAYYRYVRDQDLFLTHALADPIVDRSKSPSQQPVPYTALGVVRETDRGVIVRGAKLLATAAPYADEIIVWPFAYRTSDYTEKDKDYVVGFAIPANTPGVRFIAREPYGIGNAADHPLATRFDEIDTVVVFQDVEVPWERVFLYRRPELSSQIYLPPRASFSVHQAYVRLLTKLQFLAGIARKGAEMVQTTAFPNVQWQLGEITTMVELVRAAIVASEADAKRYGEYLVPDMKPLFALRVVASRWYPRAKEILQGILAASLLYTPASLNLLDSPIRGDIMKYFRGASVPADERLRFFKAAADVALSSFGGRHELYERFYAGDPFRLQIVYQYERYDWSEPLKLVGTLEELLQENANTNGVDGSGGQE